MSQFSPKTDMMFRRKYYISVLAVILVVACTSCADSDSASSVTSGSQNESPLSTWDPSNADVLSDASAGEGTLEITSDCARLILDNGKTILLVWPEPTSWNSTSQVIEFVGPRSERMELRDGARIRPGGFTAVGDPTDAEPDIGEPNYVLPPPADCQMDEIFVLNSVTVVAE